MMYTEEGRETAQRLWAETLEELEFGGVKEALSKLDV